MSTTAQTFEELALANPRLELHRGVMREKPTMSIAHGFAQRQLVRQLDRQLDPDRFWIVSDDGRVKRIETASYYIPDVYVVPIELTVQDRSRWNELEVYPAPLPLVVEIWSPSTGDYDIDEKIPEYMARGDLEIWRLHPFDRELKAWRRRDDGSYQEHRFTGGEVRPVALPGVVIDLDGLFP